ncbi:MAG TPA: DoxX family protein [Pirellulales bacterium]|nr:DoxX family protein [Pirellulales bacterium]
MRPEPLTTPVSKGRLWTGRVISTLPALFLLLDGVMKLVKPSFVVEATTEMGYTEQVILPLGVVLCVSTVLYLVPQTAILGAILLTGYLGGAVDAHVRHQDGSFAIFFPVVFGALLWGGLVLRDPRLGRLVPWRNLSDEPAA